MHPICFHLGPLAIHWYGVMMSLGFLAGLANWVWLGRREGRSFNDCSDLLFWIMLAGVVGARAAYVVSEWPDYAAEPLSIVRIDQGGLIYYGGFAGAGLAMVIFARVRRERLLPLLDFVVASLPLAHAFGRVGCFINGCCWGSLTTLPLGVRYPADSLPWWEQVRAGLVTRFSQHTLPVHPVQLYEAVWDLAVYGALLWLYRRRRGEGRVLVGYLLLYPLGRFGLEFLRGDQRAGSLGLSMAQLGSAVLFAAGVAVWAATRRRRIG